MRCPVCFYRITRTFNPPKDRSGEPIFLWDQVYLSDSDDDDTEAYVVEILSATKVRVLLPLENNGTQIDIWDVESASLLKMANPINYIG